MDIHTILRKVCQRSRYRAARDLQRGRFTRAMHVLYPLSFPLKERGIHPRLLGVSSSPCRLLGEAPLHFRCKASLSIRAKRSLMRP
jgi:hypothetical protein